MTFSIVSEYIDLLPEQMMIEMVIAGAIILEPSEDLNYYRAAVASGMLEGYSEHHVNESLGFLRSHGERIVSKQIGKQIPRIIAGFIASRITRGIMLNAKIDFAFKRKLARLRSTYRVLRGGPAGVLVLLLKTNGWLGVAAAESRDIRNRCPRLWSYLRLELNGADMLYFLVKDFL